MQYPKPSEIISTLDKASKLNIEDHFREGHLIHLPDYGQVVMTGDFHGCLHNFRKLVWFANLKHSIHRHVIIHELIHNYNSENSEVDNSCLLLLDAARWKIEFPEQVHFLLGNHDIAQITSREITKNGYASIASFNSWVMEHYKEDASAIIEKIRDFLLTVPLAARTENRIWMSHSIPGPHAMESLNLSMFKEQWKVRDLIPKGCVYEFVWGRSHPPEQLDKLAEMFDVDFFIVGHQAQDDGYLTLYNREIILASEHYNGCYMPIDLSEHYSFEKLTTRIKNFADLADQLC